MTADRERGMGSEWNGMQNGVKSLLDSCSSLQYLNWHGYTFTYRIPNAWYHVMNRGRWGKRFFWIKEFGLEKYSR